jgi:hypothetical protein
VLTYSKEITEMFFDLVEDEISLEKFEEWIFYDFDLEAILGQKVYSDLLSFRYSLWETKTDLRNYILGLYSNSKLELKKENIVYKVISMVNGDIGIVEGCSELARIRSFVKGYDFIPIEFVGISSEMEDVGFRYSDLKIDDKSKKERIINLYKEDVLNLSKDFLEELNE